MSSKLVKEYLQIESESLVYLRTLTNLGERREILEAPSMATLPFSLGAFDDLKSQLLYGLAKQAELVFEALLACMARLAALHARILASEKKTEKRSQNSNSSSSASKRNQIQDKDLWKEDESEFVSHSVLEILASDYWRKVQLVESITGKQQKVDLVHRESQNFYKSLENAWCLGDDAAEIIHHVIGD